MRSENATYIPNELASAVPGGAVVSADGVKDYQLGLDQETINSIVLSGNVTLGLTAKAGGLSQAFVGKLVEVTLVATCSTDANLIEIKKGVTPIGEAGSGRSIERTHQLTPVAGNNTYSAHALVGSMPKDATASIVGVLPIYYGALATYDAENLTQYGKDSQHPNGTPTNTVKRTYTMTLDGTRRFIYFKVPRSNVSGVSSVAMGSGNESSPVEGGYVPELEEENYLVWKSNDGYTGNGDQVFTVN